MTVSREDVARMARLAELAVDQADLTALAAQMDSIVSFVDQLSQLESRDGAGDFLPGPAQTPLRPDEVKPMPLARPPAALAPEFVDGFFVVPRLGALDEG